MSVRTNFAQFIRDFQTADKQRIKAGQDAVKVEGYRQMRLLQKEIEAGAPGGRKHKELREISKRRIDARLKTTHAKPLSGLRHAIRYKVTSDGRFVFEFGAVEGKVSKSWINIMKARQEQGTADVQAGLRKKLAYIGGILKGKSKLAEWPAKAFFLKTQTFENPARDIVDTFWNAHRHEVGLNIQRNFERKLRGERI